MKKVKKSLLLELYNLNTEKIKLEDGEEPNVPFDKELIEPHIYSRLTVISAEAGMDTSMIVWGLLVGIGHLSISRFFKCLEVCGVEIEE